MEQEKTMEITEAKPQGEPHPSKEEYMERIMRMPAEGQAVMAGFMEGFLYAMATRTRSMPKGA